MKNVFAIVALLFVFLGVPLHAAPKINDEEAYEIGVEAYTYAYPLVLMEMTRQTATNASSPDGGQQMMNRFMHRRAYPDAKFNEVVRPNADTLYSSLWFDVGSTPLMLTLPDTGDRYNVIPMMDMWTDVFATLGTRTTGNKGGTFALVGPRWDGKLPKGVVPIRSPTERGWIIGRIQTNGAADYPTVRKLQNGLTAAPLPAWNKTEIPSSLETGTPKASPKPAPVEQVAAMTPETFFSLFAELMKRNAPHSTDQAIVARMARIGIFPGLSFDLSKIDPKLQKIVRQAAKDAYQRIAQRRSNSSIAKGGWSVNTSTIGVYGNNYLQRASVAYAGLGALPPEEALYPMTTVDSSGMPLSGDSQYIIHFEKGQIPPAGAFWSLTMYGKNQLFVDNPLNRYALGDRDALTFNPDGSLDLFIQHASPGAGKEANWLPAPLGPFTMNLRLYLPKAEAVDGRWTPPAVVRIP